MATAIVATQFSFLASGPTFQVSIPEYLDSLPEMTTPLMNGHGGRSFDFVPYERDDPPWDELEFLRTISDPAGREVEFYKRIEPPPVWVLRWKLTNGILATHLREIDGEEWADVTVASLSIVETEGGLPFLLPETPLRFLSTSAPGFQEEITFFSKAKGDGWSVTFQRPGFAVPSAIVQSPLENTGGMILLKTGLSYGIDVQVWSGFEFDTARDVVRTILNTFSEK
jgi:hypothetical protein